MVESIGTRAAEAAMASSLVSAFAGGFTVAAFGWGVLAAVATVSFCAFTDFSSGSAIDSFRAKGGVPGAETAER